MNTNQHIYRSKCYVFTVQIATIKSKKDKIRRRNGNTTTCCLLLHLLFRLCIELCGLCVWCWRVCPSILLQIFFPADGHYTEISGQLYAIFFLCFCAIPFL